LVRNKADLLPSGTAGLKIKNERVSAQRNEQYFVLSAETGFGFEELLKALTEQAKTSLEGAEPALITRQRHRQALAEARAAVARATRALTEELLAEELRLAARALERLTGRVDVEDVLDVIFRDFCIGK
jgi:tRNA modification GTPase